MKKLAIILAAFCVLANSSLALVPHALAADVDIERVVVRGVIDPAKSELRTVSRLEIRNLSKEDQKLVFYLNPGRNVVKVLGPKGQEVPHRISSRRVLLVGIIYKRVEVLLPAEVRGQDRLELTFFLKGKVRDKGLYRPGNFLNQEGFAAMQSVLFPGLGLGLGENEDDPFLWLQLELDAPPNWTLVTGGVPEVMTIENNGSVASKTTLIGDEVERFLGQEAIEKRVRYYWEKVGINAGLFYLYGSPDLVTQTGDTLGVNVQVFTTRADSASAPVLLEAAKKTIPVLEESIGPFPFRDFSIVVPPRMLLAASSGALDSWDMITLPRSALGWRQGHQETFVHEMIHQYWTQCLRMPSSEGTPVAEASASYWDVSLWSRVYGDTLASQRGLNNRIGACQRYWRDAQVYCERPAVGLDAVDPFFFTGLYSKGALSVSMLADILGPEEFGRLQQEVFAQGDGKAYNLDSLQAGIGRHTQHPCADLVTDLFRTTTRFDYAIRDVKVRNLASDSCTVDVDVTRNQRGKFPMMLRVSFGNSAKVDTRIDPEAEQQTLSIRGPVPFKEAELDPDWRTLDCDRFNSVYPRRHLFHVAWGRRSHLEYPHPIADWGESNLSRRRFILSPLLDYTDPDGLRSGVGIEAIRAYQDKEYLWVAWSEKQSRLRAGAGCFFSSNLARYKLGAHYYDDGLVREAVFTSFLPSWENWVALSLGAGYEERPTRVSGVEKLSYAQSSPTFRLGLTAPLLNYWTGALAGFPFEGRSYLLCISVRKGASVWGGNMDYSQVEGDTRMGFGNWGLRFRWGVSGGVSNEGKGFSLGGRFAYVDDRVHTVRGYGLRCAKNFVLLNTEFNPLTVFSNYSSGMSQQWRVMLFSDLARYRDVGTGENETLLGYGIGLRYRLTWIDWLESPLIRVDYGAPKEGFGKGFLYVGAQVGI